jgi:hypothetical protein
MSLVRKDRLLESSAISTATQEFKHYLRVSKASFDTLLKRLEL